LAFFSLPLLVWVRSQIGGWIALIGTGWIASLLTAILFKKPESASKRMSMNVDRTLNIAAAIFVIGLLIVISAFVGALLLELSGITPAFTPHEAGLPTPAYELKDQRSQLAFIVASLPIDQGRPLGGTIQGYLAAFGDIDQNKVWSGLTTAPVALVLGLLLLVGIFGKRVDINKFSLHNMYKNRLVRCYLGASNQDARNEQPFTGLDDADDLPMSALGAHRSTAEGEKFRAAQRPLHILNAALNLTQGSNLAWQERKAASFTFTPLVCGYSLERTQGDSTSMDNRATGEMPGYRLTTEYGTKDHEERGFTLGMALATSGAAVSPNMGHASRPIRAFVLTLFNVRLGRWSANPANNAWRLPSPRFGLVPLLLELFGYSNERRDFVYLSDGGHFDNLGVYELVRRRCKIIFAVDAGADPTRAMGDLAETIRKCRVDLGVEIEMPELDALRNDRKGKAQRGFVKGVIRYNREDPDQNGTLILLKPTLARDLGEPPDVLNYASLNATFPQQSTADQFFDESQFESYRRLGLYIAEQCLDKHASILPTATPGGAPVPRTPQQEPAAQSTRLVYRVLESVDRAPKSYPSRDGCLVDIFLGLLLLSLGALVLFWVFDRFILGIDSTGMCWTMRGCEAQLATLSSVGKDSLAFFLRGCFDNVFVLLYGAMFACGFVVGLRNVRWKNILLPAACFLVVLTAAVDTAENSWLLSWTELKSTASPQSVIAGVTLLKSVLVTACVAVLAALSMNIGREFRKRWLP